jgi:DNA-binding CsgD family transcriptional regulator
MLKHLVRLSDPEREFLRRLLHRRGTSALRRNLAQILLRADEERANPSSSEDEIARALDTTGQAVERVCERFVASGLDNALTPELTAEEQQAVEKWYAVYGRQVIAEVRRWLREATRHRTAVSNSDLAESVWASFLENRLHEVDPEDEESIWAVLAESARRHCEAWNRYGTRHKQRSLSALLAAYAEGAQDRGLDANDTREPPPEVSVMVEDCLAVLCGVEGRQSGALVEGLGQALTAREREVAALLLADLDLDQIAVKVGLDLGTVRDIWGSIRRKAQRLERESSTGETDPIGPHRRQA